MSSDQPRRSRDTGSPGSPVGSTAAIIIAIVAVVAGFLILRAIRSDDEPASSLTDTSNTQPAVVAADSTLPPTAVSAAPTTPTIPPVTTPVAVVEGATVIVANASTVNGAAAILTTALTGASFTTGTATNATAKQEDTTVLYDPSDPEALAVATYLGSLLGSVVVSPVSTPAPIDGGLLPEGVSIIVMLGSDKANLTLQAMGTATTLPAAGATTIAPTAATLAP